MIQNWMDGKDEKMREKDHDEVVDIDEGINNEDDDDVDKD